MNHTKEPCIAFESAYPGSMFEREDGGYIRRDDADSLANSLLALIKSGDRAASDSNDALKQMDAGFSIIKSQRDKLLAALKSAVYAIKGREHTGSYDALIKEVEETL
jgi:hypothetical protein